MVVIGAVLMVGHWVSLPTPERTDATLNASVSAIAAPDSQHWKMVHVLYSQCRCSQRIFDYLFERESPQNTDEVVLLVGPPGNYAKQARAAGFKTHAITREDLKLRFQIESAPLLLITAPDGEIRYAGGYTGRKQAADYRDLKILDELQRGGTSDDLPLFGCGVSQELQAYLDPIGLKYDRNAEYTNMQLSPSSSPGAKQENRTKRP